jgi:SAM-dependent methyltransferase
VKDSDSAQPWDPALYDAKHSFVWRYGAELVELLAPQAGERILDLGCGTGHLTHRIAQCGAAVVGMDRSLAMLAQARKNYPRLPLVAADATCFAFARPFDAVFSNATLHWILDAERVVECVAQSLRPGGRFVAEFGGKGNIRTIRAGFEYALDAIGYPEGRHWHPLYFPGDAEYAALLVEHGFKVQSAVLFDRPTELEDAERGMRNWLEQFERDRLARVPAEKRPALLDLTEERLRPHLFRDRRWFVDYVRLRVLAIRA